MSAAEPEAVTESRWFGVGHSTLDDAASAGKEAALQAITGGTPKLVMVFSSVVYDGEAMLRGIRAVEPDAALIGCSTGSEIATSGPVRSSVVVVALGGDGFDVVPIMRRGVSGRLHEAGAEVARSVYGLPDDARQRVLLLLTDGLSGNQQEVVRGAYGVLGGTVPLVGGCSGNDRQVRQDHHYFGDEVVTDAIVAVAIASDAPMGIGIEHGMQRVGEPMLVTRAEDNLVLELDGRPALDVYLDRLDAGDEVRTDIEAFRHVALTHPLGLATRRGEEVRHIHGADFDDRSLAVVAEIPEGGMVWFMRGDTASITQGARVAADAAVAGLGDRPPIGLLAFDCIARRDVLGDEGTAHEIGLLAACADGAPVAGFYTYGEIARLHGMSGFHNQTMVVLAVS